MRAVGARLDVSKLEELAQTVYAFERALSGLASMPVLWLLYARFLQQQALITRTRRGTHTHTHRYTHSRC